MASLVSVTVTAATESALAEIVAVLVEERLVACGNIVPAIRSIYRWGDAVHDDHEALALLHTTAALAEAVIRRISELHDYDVPQALAVPISHAQPDYAAWVESVTQQQP